MKYVILAASLLVIPFLSGCAQVGPGEVGIKQEFGKVEPRLYDPGLHMLNPLTQQFHTQSVQKVTVDSTDENNGLTRTPSTIDQLPIEVEYSVIYFIPKGQVLSLYMTVQGDPFDKPSTARMK